MKKMLIFDMDGTIADLYGVDDWLPKLRAESPEPYENAAPMWDMDELAKILQELEILKKWETRVITWLSKDSSKEYKKAVTKAKREWLVKYGFPAYKVHAVQYGATKANSIRKIAEYAILFDDNAKVRKGWKLGETVNPEDTDIINYLKKLLEA